MKHPIMISLMLTTIVLVPRAAGAFPLGFSAIGGIGAGYYDMSQLNRHIGEIGQERRVPIDQITGGINFRVEGRVWILNHGAITGGYEHFWADASAEGTSATLSYQAPADVYTIGAIVTLLRIENVMNLSAGVSRCLAHAYYGTNELVERRLTEYKGEDRGYEAYAEAHSNFLNPIEVGLQLGYRWLNVDTFTDKTGEVAFFEPGQKIQIDYSGVFFYLTAGIRL